MSRRKSLGIAIVPGAGVGAAVGVATGQIGLWVAVGVAVGVAVAYHYPDSDDPF